MARGNRTALEVYRERAGVCRDYMHLAITFCRCLNVPARYCTGYLGDIGVPPLPCPMDFSAWFEVYLGGRWCVFDARHNTPRIGRVLMARGRDAADVALTTTFGMNTLQSFQVWTDEVPAESLQLATSALIPSPRLLRRGNYLSLRVATKGRLGQRKEHHFFAGCRADVVVQAHDGDARDLLNHFFHDRPGRFDQVHSHLLEQIPSLVGGERSDKLLLGCRQDAFEAYDDKITYQIGVDVFWATAHVLLFEARDPGADGRFDFSLSLHSRLGEHAIPAIDACVSSQFTARAGNGRQCADAHEIVYQFGRSRHKWDCIQQAMPYSDK